MARPAVEVPEAAALRALIDDQGRLAVRATPGARVEKLELAEGKVLAKVRAKPESGKANEAVRELLAMALGIAPSRLELLRGQTSRDKLFRVFD